MKAYYTILFLLLTPLLSYSQAATETATPGIPENKFSIGIYGGPNITWEKIKYDSPFLVLSPSTGSDYSILGKMVLYKNIFASTGVMYAINTYSYSDELKGSFIITPNPNLIYGNIFPTSYNYHEYTIGIPLILDYGTTHNKWSFYGGLGIEFYYNYEDVLLLNNTITIHFYKGRIITSPYGLLTNNYWSALNAYGILHAGVSYHISSAISVSFMPTWRFTDPFAESTFSQSFRGDIRENALSFNLGLNYSFSRITTGVFHTKREEESHKFSIGFSVVPTELTNKLSLPPGYYFAAHSNNRFSFSYEIPLEYVLSNHFTVETGIAIDNFNYIQVVDNVLIGLPAMVDYSITPNDAQSHSLYIGAGLHIDYPTNDGGLYAPARSYILPLAIGKIGYRVSFGDRYYWDINAGYEASLSNPYNGNNFVYVGLDTQMSGMPHYVFLSTGLGYRL